MLNSKVKGYLTIKGEIFLLSFSVFILVLLLFSGIFLKMLYNNNVDYAKNSLRQCNGTIVTFVEGLFRENATIVKMLSHDDKVINAGYGNQEDVIRIFSEIKQNNANITYLYSGYADGKLFIDDQYTVPADFSSIDRPWFVSAIAVDGVARLAYSDAATGVWLFSQCTKLINSKGWITGVVSVDCSNESIVSQLNEIYEYASQRSFIFRRDGKVLIHPNEKEINTSLKSHIEEAVWQDIIAGKGNYAEYVNNGVAAMAYFERIPESDFFVATAIDADEVLQPIMKNIGYIFLLILIISIVLGFALSHILIQRFALPIMALESRIRHIAAGREVKERDFRFSNVEINSIADSIEIIVKDIADREEQRKAAEFLSFHDSMTGLYNRRFFENELRRLDVERNYPLCLVCCDINGLKLANDVFGHAVGDRLILTIANCLTKACRADDILARIGGDEFAVILPRTSATDAQKVMQRIKTFFPTESIGGAEVSASLGYAIKNDSSKSLEDLSRAADDMMYERKLKESTEMKRCTVLNIIAAAEQEGLVRPLSTKEICVLDALAEALCSGSQELLKESYRLRKIGLCTLVAISEGDEMVLNNRYPEIGYRILSSLDMYRSAAGCIMHYKEHWDGSGWAGLSGMDIPLLSRIIAVVEAYFDGEGMEYILSMGNIWYDQEIITTLIDFLEIENYHRGSSRE